MIVLTASNATELHAALGQAQAGDTIELASGNYGDFFLRDANFTSDVTIVAQSSDAPPVFDNINLWNVSHLAFDGITVNMVPDDDTRETSSAFKASKSSDISVINSTLVGGPAVNGVDPSVDPGEQGSSGINGYPIGRGFNFFQSENITLSGNDISSFTTGALFSSVDGISMVENTIFGTRKTPVNGGDVSNVVMTDNTFSDITPWKFGGLGDHGDFIHFWTTPTQVEPSENFVFSNNFFNQGDGVAILGIYLDDNRNDTGFRNVEISENVMHNGNAQGLRLEDVIGGTITNNTFLQSSGDVRDAPGFYLADGSKDLFIDNNVIASITTQDDVPLSENNIITGTNIFVQSQDALSDNYTGTLFTNAKTTNANLEDLRAIPGTAVDGIGAAKTQFVTDGTFNGYIDDERGEGLSLNNHTFSLADGFTGVSSTYFEGAAIVWDLGDGATASGNLVSHAYESAGTYETTATITHRDGTVEQFTRVIDVLDPMPVELDFESNTAIQRSTGTNDNIIGQVDYVKTSMGTSLRLDEKSALKIDGTGELRNNADFSLSIGFSKDAGHEDEGGRILYYSGTAVIDVTDDQLILRARTSDGEAITLRTGELPINNTDWHQITYTFSQSDGSAILYLNGEEVARADGLTGQQHVTSGHNLYIGNPFGENIEGVLDQAMFVRSALTPDQVTESYDAFTRGDMPDFAPMVDPQNDVNETTQPVIEPTQNIDKVTQDIEESIEIDFGVTEISSEKHISQELDIRAIMQTDGGVLDGTGEYMDLGRLRDIEASNKVAFEVEYSREANDYEDSARLVWNHKDIGLTLDGDALIIHTATANEGFKQFRVEGLGLANDDLHKIAVLLDGDEDRLQVTVDEKVVLDERSTDFEVASNGGHEWGWSLGTQWNRHFEGEVTSFRVGDDFDFQEEQPLVGNDPLS